MRTLAILPVKSFGSAKQRLSSVLAKGAREALAQAMFSDVLGALRHAASLEAIAVVTADPLAQSASGGGRVIVIRDDARAGQSAATLIGIRHALASDYEHVLLVPGDTPLLDPAEIDRLVEGSGEGVVVVPDRHSSGTNALVLTPPDVLTPSFGPGSLERHVACASDAGVSCRVEVVESLAHDVDTPEDLADLAGLLEASRGLAPMTRGALRQLERTRAWSGPGVPAQLRA